MTEGRLNKIKNKMADKTKMADNYGEKRREARTMIVLPDRKEAFVSTIASFFIHF